jgi:phage terminase small subunit
MMTKTKRLTAKQLALVEVLLTTEKISIEAAGVKAGFSAKTAAQIASRTLALPHVKAYYDEQLAARAKRTGIDADYVLQRLADIDQMDIADLYDERGEMLPVHKWPRIWRQNVKEVDLKTGKIKLQDKLRTLELIGKHVGVRAFAEQIEVKDTTGLAARLNKAKKRLAGEGSE